MKEKKSANIDKSEHWRDKEYAFFTHKKCEAFPCHSGLEETSFNCLFCYCPLYALDDKCGGNFVYLENGVKNCSECTVPHVKGNYGYINGRFEEIAAMMKDARTKRQGGGQS